VPRGVNAPGARFREFVNKVPTLAARYGEGEGLMKVIHPRCSGLDVHKETVMACVRLALGDKVTREFRTFETTTSGLLLLLAWLTELGCTHVAMEATGVYLYELSQPFYGGVFCFYPPNNLSKGHHAGLRPSARPLPFILGMIAPLLGCAERSTPGSPKGRAPLRARG
jgi:hypothetical protein